MSKVLLNLTQNLITDLQTRRPLICNFIRSDLLADSEVERPARVSGQIPNYLHGTPGIYLFLETQKRRISSDRKLD